LGSEEGNRHPHSGCLVFLRCAGRDSKAGAWQCAGGTLQPAWLFRRKANPSCSASSSQASYRLRRFFLFHKRIIARSLCCSSPSNCKRSAGLQLDFGYSCGVAFAGTVPGFALVSAAVGRQDRRSIASGQFRTPTPAL